MGEEFLNAADAPVRCSTISTASGHRIGRLVLNVEATLNALSLEMIDLLANQLDRWQATGDVVAIWCEGAGDRAFAAGGDIQALYHAIRANQAAGRLVDDYAESFFEREYRFDYHLHTTRIPVLAWGQGVVMGGGLGIFSAADLRVVTPRSRMAMPEITIGLFPDAGGSWWLAGLEPPIARFLALTGVHFNGADACFLGLGTHFVENPDRLAVLAALQAANWQGEPAADLAQMTQVLDSFASDPPESPLANTAPVLREALGTADATVAELATGLRGLKGTSEWVDRGLHAFEGGSPITAGIIVEQLRRVPGMALADTFRMEMVIATHCARNLEFAEGVRALLIEKDNQPAWQFPHGEVPDAVIAAHFSAPWPVSPLADLG